MKIYNHCKVILSLVSFLVIFIVQADDQQLNTDNEDNISPLACDFETTLDSMDINDPEGVEQRRSFEKKLTQHIVERKKILRKRFATQRDALKNAPSYTIPVVFHVYGTDFERRPKNGAVVPVKVDVAFVKKALAVINDDFATSNNSKDQVFQPIEGGMNVKFKLAQIGPDGNTTTGVIYHEYQEGFALAGVNDDRISKYAWDNYKYFNVHIQVVLKNNSRSKSGTAYLPKKDMSDKGTARVVYNGKYLLNPSSFGASSITHEFGHWLNLYHTFEGGCVADTKEGDKVADTPPTDQPKKKSCGYVENCFGNPVNVENHMDYHTECESMFTQGQVDRMEASMQHPARATLWEDANLIETGVKNKLGPRIIFNYQEFNDSNVDKETAWIEDFHQNKNDGSIINKHKIKAVDGARFSRSNGPLIEGVDYVVSDNIPAGLSLDVRLLDDTTAELSLIGNAVNHEKINSTNLKVTLLNNAIEGGLNKLFSSEGRFRIVFSNSFSSEYGVLSKQYYVSKSGQNNALMHTQYDFVAIGKELTLAPINFDGDSIGFESIRNKIEFLTHKNSNNIRRLNDGVKISKSLSGDWFIKKEKKQFPALISSPTYTNWNGRLGYAAIRVPTIRHSYIYGWIKLKVSKDGSTFNVIGWGINTKSDTGTIESGYKSHKAINFLDDRFIESNKNDGSIENNVKVELYNLTFSRSGELQEGLDYKLINLPKGLNLRINVTNNTSAIVSISGKANRHDWGSYKKTKIQFLDGVFRSLDNLNEVVGISKNILFEFRGESFKNKDKSRSILKSSQSIDRQVTFGSQKYTDKTSGNIGGLKLLTYRKDALANRNNELIPLNYGDEIGPNSAWQPGREYWSHKGQHMIDSDSTGYHAFRGKTRYIGVRFRRSSKIHYGWIKVKLNKNGSNFKFLEFGVNGQYGKAIKAGSLDSIEVGDDTTSIPEPISPNRRINDNTPTFTWRAVKGINKYAIAVYSGKKPGKRVLYKFTPANCSNGICRYVFRNKNFPRGSAYWKIRTEQADGKNGKFSIEKTFTIN